MADGVRDAKIQIFFCRPNSDELAFVRRSGRVLEPKGFVSARRRLRLRAQNGRFRRGRDRRGSRRDRVGRLLSPDAREVGAEAWDGEDDSSVLSEPLADCREALSLDNRCPDLRPKSSQLAGFGGWLFPAPSCEAASGLRRPLLSCLGIFFAFCHAISSLRYLSTFFNEVRHFSTCWQPQKPNKHG